LLERETLGFVDHEVAGSDMLAHFCGRRVG
jgi:hypothetical protein